MDKDPEVQAVYQLPRIKQFIDKKARRSVKTGRTYLSALVKLNAFTKKEYNHNAYSIVDTLLKMKVNVYDLLDGFISFLPTVKEGITANTIGNYIAALKSYFGANDIDIVPSKFKHKVTLPRKNNEKELPIDASDIRKILLSCSNRRLKSYILILCSSGVRADTEACSIRNRDIDFASNPVKIHIRADYTKTKTARDVYLTDEAVYHLKQWKKFKNNNEQDELVFAAYENDIPHTVEDTKRIANNIYFRLTVEFAKLLTSVGMDQRKETGIIEKRRHLITLHSFRRFTFSIINNQTNTAFAEFILGHANTPYHTVKQEVIKDLFLTRCMTALTVLDYKVLEETGKNHESRLKQKEQEIAILKIKERQHYEEMAQQKEQMNEMLTRMSQMEKERKEDTERMERARKEDVERLLSLIAKESIVGEPALPRPQIDLVRSGELSAIPLDVSDRKGEDVKHYTIHQNIESVKNNPIKGSKKSKTPPSDKSKLIILEDPPSPFKLKRRK